MSTPKIPISQRGSIEHEKVQFGETAEGLPMEIYLPARFKEGFLRLIVAGIHGDESEGPYLLSKAMRSIRPTDLTSGVVLAANPGGILRNTRGNTQGVDLNRNFPTHDWEPGDDLHQWKNDGPKNVKLSVGNTPGSEAETEHLITLIQDQGVQEVVSLHSPMNMLVDPTMSDLGARIAKKTGIKQEAAADIDGAGTFPRWGEENGITIMDYELPMESRIELQEGPHYPAVLGLITGKI